AATGDCRRAGFAATLHHCRRVHSTARPTLTSRDRVLTAPTQAGTWTDDYSCHPPAGGSRTGTTGGSDGTGTDRYGRDTCKYIYRSRAPAPAYTFYTRTHRASYSPARRRPFYFARGTNGGGNCTGDYAVTDPIIITKNLCHTYQSGPLLKAALVDINLEIERGSCVAIIGVTGSGKSTLVQHFNGLLHPTAGTIIVDGINVSAKGARDPDLQTLRRRVGMLFQFPEAQLFEHTVYADVAFGPRRMKLSKHEVRTRVLKALETVGLPPRDFAQRSP